MLLFAEMPTVVRPEHDDRVFRMGAFVQRIDDSANLFVGESDGSQVALNSMLPLLVLGDLGVIALFADPDRATLPLQMYRLMGSYQTQAAAGAALILLVLAFGLFWILDYWGRRNAIAE